MLKVSGLHLHYGASHALRGIDLVAERGKITCVLGRNGVGKTSLMRAVTGLENPSAGSITWDDMDLLSLPVHKRASAGVAFVPQGREIFPLLTVKENLETGYARLPRKERSVPGDVFELFPILKSMLSRRGGDLSGGQQQQLAIGRALVTRPKVLVLDEPTEGIQPSIIREMARTLRRIRDERGLSIVVSEQVLSFALDVADRVLVLENGRLVHDEPRASIDEKKVAAFLSV